MVVVVCPFSEVDVVAAPLEEPPLFVALGDCAQAARRSASASTTASPHLSPCRHEAERRKAPTTPNATSVRFDLKGVQASRLQYGLQLLPQPLPTGHPHLTPTEQPRAQSHEVHSRARQEELLPKGSRPRLTGVGCRRL